MIPIVVKCDTTNINLLTEIKIHLCWTVQGKEHHCQCVEYIDTGLLVVNTVITGRGRLRKDDYTFLYKNFQKEFNEYADDEDKEMSQNDTLALNIAEKSVRILDDGHLEIAVPIITYAKVPNNHSSAITRLESERCRFLTNI